MRAHTESQLTAVSTGNVYRYFENKEVLFEHVVSPEFAKRFMSTLKRRVASLAVMPDLATLDARAREHGEQLLSFWVEHRLKVVVILDRARGSAHAGFAGAFVGELTRSMASELRKKRHEARLGDTELLLLTTIFDNTRRAIVAILESTDDAARIRAAFAGFWSYQLAGLAGFTKWVTKS